MFNTFGVPLDPDLPAPAIKRARGLDLSEAQGAAVDFVRVREEGGFDFVILKATEGDHYVDPRFARNARLARATGLLVGAYLFLGKLSKIADQVTLFRRVTEGTLDLPPWLDLETPPPNLWTPSLDGDYLTKRALEAADLIVPEVSMVRPVIYSYPDFLRHLPVTPELRALAEMCDLAYAHYANQKVAPKDTEPFPVPPAPWTCARFLQWSGDGGLAAPGVPCVVDHDLFSGTVEELRGIPAVEVESAEADAAL